MGGYNSGRRRGRAVEDECSRLDLATLGRWLRPGEVTDSFQLWRGGRSAALIIRLVIDLRADPGRATIQQRVDGAWADMQPWTPIRFTRQHLGGQRAWWQCRCCGRRVRVLYCPPGASLFACRRCYRLTYASSNASDKRVSALLNDPSALAGFGAGAVDAPLGQFTVWFNALYLHWRRSLQHMPPGRRRRAIEWYEARMGRRRW